MPDYQPKPQFNNPINFGPDADKTPANVVPLVNNNAGFGNNRQAEDMFAVVDETPQAPATTVRPFTPSAIANRQMPTPPVPNRAVGMDMIEQPPATRGSFKYLLIGVATLVILFIIGVFVYQLILKPRLSANSLNTVDNTDLNNDLLLDVDVNDLDNDQIVDDQVLDNTLLDENGQPLLDTVNEDLINDTAEPVVLDRPADSDGDGLSDEQEAILKTDPQMIDTDDDGLTDKDEVQIYNTDPLDPDTDGDTYLDGQEVKGGYNPNGAGKLFDAKAI